MRDYTKKVIYLGIDVHKLSYSITAICEGEVVKRDRIPADHAKLLNYCRKFYPKAFIKSAYEAGFSGFSLHRFLIENEIQNIVVHPASIEVQVNNRVKTDKRDSLKIAFQLSQGNLKSVYIPTPEQEACRSVSRFRSTLIKQRTSCINRIKSFLHYLGFNIEFKITKRNINKLCNIELLENNKFCLELMLDEWASIYKNIQLCEERLKKQNEEDELVKYYTSVPGIGKTIARVLSNELGDMSQFKNEKNLFSYCGLTPCEYSSGEKIRKGHITRQGKPLLRMYLNQAAWRAIRRDSELKEAFDNISMRAGSKRAITAIARKLIGRIRSCILNKEFYNMINNTKALVL